MSDVDHSLVVRFSKYDDNFHFDILAQDQSAWGADLSASAEERLAAVVANLCTTLNDATRDSSSILAVCETLAMPSSFEDPDLYMNLDDPLRGMVRIFEDGDYTVFASKDAQSLKRFFEMIGVFAVYFPAGIREDIWLRLGDNFWDFLLCANVLDEASIAAVFAVQGMRLVLADPPRSILLKTNVLDMVSHFTKIALPNHRF